MQPTQVVLLFFYRAEPTEALVRRYCSVSGVDSRLYFQIQNQINFVFKALEKIREEVERSQVKRKDSAGFF